MSRNDVLKLRDRILESHLIITEMQHHHLQLPIYLNCFHYKTVLVLSTEETVTTHNYECTVFCSVIKRPTTLQLTKQDHFNLVKLVA